MGWNQTNRKRGKAEAIGGHRTLNPYPELLLSISSNLSVVASTPTTVSWTNVVQNDYGAFNVSDPTKVIALFDCYVYAYCQGVWAAIGDDTRRIISVRKDGAEVAGSDLLSGLDVAEEWGHEAHEITPFLAGNELTVVVEQQSAGALNFLTSSLFGVTICFPN